MADFTTLDFQCNTGSNASPTWTSVTGANHEVRFHDTSTVALNTASASWPYVVKPTSGTSGIDYAYAATADTTLLGVLGSAGAPTAFNNSNYLQARWVWDNVGTFATAPIFTSYPNNGHGGVTRDDGSVLGGKVADTGATARSYLKGNAFGRVSGNMATATSASGANAPAAAPSNAPVVTDGTTGSVSPTAGANWLTNYQALAALNCDYITAPFTPSAPTNFDSWHVMFRIFSGANLVNGTYAHVFTLVYSYT